MFRSSRFRFPIVAIALATVVASGGVVSVANAQQAEGQVNLAAALSDTCVVGVMLPQRLRADKSMELMPWEVITVAGVEEFGVDPLTIERVFMFVKTPDDLIRPPRGGIVIHLNRAADEEAIVKATGAERIGEKGSALYSTPKLPLMFTVANPNTIVAVNDRSLLVQILTKPTEVPNGGLIDLVREAVAGHDAAMAISVDAIRTQVKTMLADGPEFPAPYESLKTLPDLISTITIRAKVTDGGSLGMKVTAVDEAAGEKLETMANRWLEIGKEMVLNQMQAELRDQDDPYAAAMQLYTQRVSGKVVDSLRPSREGAELAFFDHKEGPSMNGMATNAVLVALLLPAVQSAREAARRMSSSNNLKQIGLAMHNYADAYGKLPAQASYDENGRPLLSWRVHILPFIDQQALYNQFKLDEPWDSPHNIELSKVVVDVYRNPNMNPSNKTVYLAVTGQGMFMDGNNQRRFQDILDGTSNTIMVVEADESEAVVWTKPDDLEVDLNDPFKGLGNLRPQIFNASFMDGSVRAISVNTDPMILKAMFTIAGGETIPR